MIALLESSDYFTIQETDPKTWVHYAINTAVYTHFTCPLKRYPDIMVQRQLKRVKRR